MELKEIYEHLSKQKTITIEYFCELFEQAIDSSNKVSCIPGLMYFWEVKNRRDGIVLRATHFNEGDSRSIDIECNRRGFSMIALSPEVKEIKITKI